MPEDQRACPRCGEPLSPSDAADSEQVEIEVKAYRRPIRRRRYQRTCTCANCPRAITASAAPELIPKGVLGVSVWVEVLLDKSFSHRPTGRWLSQWQLLGRDVAAGTVAGGLKQIEPLCEPLHDALQKRNAASPFAQADETRWMVFITHDGKTGYRWWLWVFLGEDTVVFRLDPTRGHEVPEGHFPAHARVVLMVGRYSACKAMARVKLGDVVLVFCWAHVRRDFVSDSRVGSPRSLPSERAGRERRIHHGRHRPTADRRGHAKQSRADAELADPKLATPCRRVLRSLREHRSGLTRFLDDPRIPLDNNVPERRSRGPALGRKNYYGSGALWSGRLAATLFSLFATLTLAKINVGTWLTWFLNCCAEDGGRVPSEITAFLPGEMSAEERLELATDRDDSC